MAVKACFFQKAALFRILMKEFLRFTGLQFLVCTAFTYNFRAVARGDIANTIASEIAYSLINFIVVRKVANSERSGWAMAGYACGNVLGSVTTIVVTRWFWGA